MNRSDLVIALADRFPALTRHDAEAAVRVILDTMADALARGHRVEVRDFGRFAIKRRAPRAGRNPSTGAAVSVPEKRAPHFKPGKGLRDAVNVAD
jgi:integration host factor subunit beta